MYLIEKELRSQFDALLKTAAELKKCKEEAQKVLAEISSLCVLGCGSSFSLAKSAATQFSQNTGTPAYAVPAGDLLVNFPSYKKLRQHAVVAVPLRLHQRGHTGRPAVQGGAWLQGPICLCKDRGAC